MELREFAERVLFATALEDKLARPELITDEQPGPAILTPAFPGRPANLRFKPQSARPGKVPGLRDLERQEQRGRLLHFFANHELLATELMALVLLRFPDAPAAFRRAVSQTLLDEQEHTRWYLRRMQRCGVAFGEQPVSGYFWRAVSSMDTPTDYVVRLSLTFEQANLDFAHFFSGCFAEVGDLESSRLLRRIYQDEIGHVACGLKWFRKWKDSEQSDWDAYRASLNFPLSPQRAKGPGFNAAGRFSAGFDQRFVEQLNAFSQSKGRTPDVYLFNPFAEGCIAAGAGFTPNKHQQLLHADLENLTQFLCRQDDVVLVNCRPAPGFLGTLQAAGFAIPEFVQLQDGKLGAGTPLTNRKLKGLRPWAWGPDSLATFAPLFPALTSGQCDPRTYYNEKIAGLYSKEWSAALLKEMLDTASELKDGEGKSELNWLCTREHVGVGAGTLAEVKTQVEAIRGRGHHAIIVKQALGVAGQNAIRLLEPELLARQWRWISRALENGRRVLVEPWLERVEDFSIQLEMEQRGLKVLGFTGLLTDWRGQYLGNFVRPKFQRRPGVDWRRWFPQFPNLSGDVFQFYARLFSALEKKLREANYRGPLGIDAFIYKTPEGHRRLKPLVELNPRYTMGRLALELMRYVAPGSTGTFRLINRPRIKADGFDGFPSFVQASRQRVALQRQGQPVPKITSGFLPLSDPDCARVCLPVFEIVRSGTRLE